MSRLIVWYPSSPIGACSGASMLRSTIPLPPSGRSRRGHPDLSPRLGRHPGTAGLASDPAYRRGAWAGWFRHAQSLSPNQTRRVDTPPRHPAIDGPTRRAMALYHGLERARRAGRESLGTELQPALAVGKVALAGTEVNLFLRSAR